MNLDATAAQIDLAGQVAIVTGGGRGIGRAIAQGLAHAGAAVAVVSRTRDEVEETARLIEEAGGRALAFRADVTDQPAIKELAAGVEEQLGPIDLLVGNAGITGPAGPAWEVDQDEWWRCMDVNLRGPFLCSRAVLPGMVARRQGRIITVTSGSGLAPMPNDSAYAVAKCAAIRLCETWLSRRERMGSRSLPSALEA